MPRPCLHSPGSIFITGVTQTSEKYTTWQAYAPKVSRRRCFNTLRWQQIHQRCHPDVAAIHGLVSIFTRDVTQTLLEYRAPAAFSPEVSPRHWRNAQPCQHMQYKRHPDIAAKTKPASISSRCVTQTLEECTTWPAHEPEVSTRPCWHIH